MLELQWFLNMRFRGKPICMCGKNKRKVVPSPASRTSSLLHDDSVFLIMGIVKVTRMPATMRAHCWMNKGVEPTQVI